MANIKKVTQEVMGKDERNRLIQWLASSPSRIMATHLLLIAFALGATVPVIGAMALTLPAIFGPFLKKKKYHEISLRRAAYHLHTRGLINVRNTPGGEHFVLTPQGWSCVHMLNIESLVLPQQQKWDKRWRVIMFDMPVQYNRARSAFRSTVKKLGCMQVQKSVWIYPYPCEREILFIADFFDVARFIEIMTVQSFLHEKHIRAYFKLPLE